MTLNPAVSILGFVLLGLIPPLILALYFLKLRRTPLEVPSTYLWTRTIEDMHVNSIWQRLRNSLLLLLQLLMAFLLLLACLGPGCEGERLAGNRFIFLVDKSASMSATDAPGGMTRLEYAKAEIQKLIDAMRSDDSAMIIAFSDESDVVQSYTRSKSILSQKLAQIEQTQRGSDITEALTAASGLANPGRTSDRTSERDIQVADAVAAQMYIFSDGAVKQVREFSLGNLSTQYFAVGDIEIPHNVGITAFAISDDIDSAGLEAFARIQNSDDEDHTVDIELYVNDEIFDLQKDRTIPAEQSVAVSFPMQGLLTNLEESVPVRLEIKSDDVYSQDNVAHGVIRPPRKANALVITKHNPYLKSVFATDRLKKFSNVEFQEPEFLESKEYAEKSTLGSYDLVIYEYCSPKTMPKCNTMFVDSLPPEGLDWSFGEPQFPTIVIDTDKTHPVMFNVGMANVQIAEGKAVNGPKGTLELVETTYGSIASIGPREGFQDLVIGFSVVRYDDDGSETINSDWYNNFSFPLFMQNVLVTLGGGASFDASESARPGQLINYRTKLPTQTTTVRAPDGTGTVVKSRADNTFVYSGTSETGVYSVTDDELQTVDQMFAINLLDPMESNLVVREKLEIGFEEIQGKTESVPETKQYWTWVALAALAVLMIEWLIYNRRVFI